MAVEGELGTSLLAQDPHEGNCVFAKSRLILSAVEITVDLSFVAFVGQNLDVLAQFGLRLRSATQQMLEVQLHEAIRSVRFKEASAVLRRLCDGAYQFAGAEVALGELAFGGHGALRFHQMGVSHHLARWRGSDH